MIDSSRKRKSPSGQRHPHLDLRNRTTPTLTEAFCPVSEQLLAIRDTYPGSVALSYGDRQLSYEELVGKADRFAGYLLQLGIAPGDTVAVCMERSFDWIVAALGIMRAGAVYVPLDCAWPDSRLRFAINDSDATVLVARAALLDRLRVTAYGVDPCRDAAAIARIPELAWRPIHPDSLAYVIYTSGSTGVPKGVEITHANLGHLIRWHLDTFKITRRDRASHLAGLGFDAAVWEIWPNLAAGATVCLADDEVRSSPDQIQKWMIRQRVTIGFVPTVHATPMIAMGWPVNTALRLLLTGGDTLHHAPSVQLPFDVVNNYGPTECTVVATSTVLKAGSREAPPIGAPITGTTIYLLNENGGQVPDGCTGEIYIGGSGVGRGYRNLPGLTEQKFLPDPFAVEQGARMFRTGDRGVRRADGEIEFCGRLDRQIKIRGQRVELDEIGSALIRHPSIEFAAAITNVTDDGENQLLAYVLPKAHLCIPTVHELKMHLLQTLPDYMIPNIFVRLSALPLSPSGKLDLTMLAQPTDANLLQRMEGRAPAGPIEEKMLVMVRKLLENDAVRVEDSFFLAGGHSLLGMQLVIRLRAAFGVDVSLRQLFEAPTVERLALLVKTKVQEERLVAGDKLAPPSAAPALQPDGTRSSIFWIYYLSAGLAKAMGDDKSLRFVVPNAKDFALLGETPTMQSVAACLVPKILAAQSKGPYVIGGLCLGGILAYEIASQLRAAGREVSLLVIVDSPNPSHIQTSDSLASKVRYLRYAVKRVVRLGLRLSLFHFRQHLIKRPAMKVALQAAALGYKPKKYEGKVLLLLASERAPHADFLPGWQAVVPHNLHTQYVDGHRSDLLGKNVHTVANAITSHLPKMDEDCQSDLNGL